MIDFDKLMRSDCKIGTSNRYEFIFPIILKGTGRCIDIGSATVIPFQQRIEEQGFKYYGVELRGGKNRLRMDAVDLGIKSDMFDMAVVSCMLGYVEKWKNVFNEVYRILKSGGLLYFYESLWSINGDFVEIPKEKQGWVIDIPGKESIGYRWGPSLEAVIGKCLDIGFGVPRMYMRFDFGDCLMIFKK